MSSVTTSNEYSMEQSIVETIEPSTVTSSTFGEETTSSVNSNSGGETSHQPVATVSYRPLLSPEEVTEIEGKLRCLYKLLQYPRRHLEEIQKTLNETLGYYQTVLQYKDSPYNENDKRTVSEGLKKIQIREDVLIRVIAGEQSYYDAVHYHAIKRLENPSIYE